MMLFKSPAKFVFEALIQGVAEPLFLLRHKVKPPALHRSQPGAKWEGISFACFLSFSPFFLRGKRPPMHNGRVTLTVPRGRAVPADTDRAVESLSDSVAIRSH